MNKLTHMTWTLQTRVLAVATRRGDRGAAMVEYALLVALIAIVAIVALNSIGDELSTNFSEIDSSIQAT